MHKHTRHTIATAAAAALTGGLLTAAAGTASAAPSGLQGDFNGDGYRDIAVSAPYATVGGASKAGQIAVMYGSANGLKAASRTLISQNSSGVPGTAETGDYFGTATTAGDFNHDGYADLAVGAPGEDVGSDTDGGTVVIIWGSASGLSGGTTVSNPASSQNDGYGQSLAAGDFDHNGRTDLAIGNTSASVWVYKGGFTKSGGTGGKYSVKAPIHTGSGGGALQMTSGQFDGTGGDELMVSGYSTTTDQDANYLFYGSPTGGSGLAYRSTPDKLPPGFITAMGDINGDGRDDIVTGETWDSGITGAVTGGKVSVIYGNTSRQYSATSISQNTAGVPDSSEAGDAFGWEVSLGDINGDGYADLAIGAIGENIGTVADTGAVTVLYGSASGLSTRGAQFFHQDTPGVPGANEKSDLFGGEVFLSDVNGDGKADLAVGDMGENSFDGAIVTLKSSGTSLTTSGSLSIGPSSVGVSTAGTPQFGSVMAG